VTDATLWSGRRNDQTGEAGFEEGLESRYSVGLYTIIIRENQPHIEVVFPWGSRRGGRELRVRRRLRSDRLFFRRKKNLVRWENPSSSRPKDDSL
jgi:hypothetical protein